MQKLRIFFSGMPCAGVVRTAEFDSGCVVDTVVPISKTQGKESNSHSRPGRKVACHRVESQPPLKKPEQMTGMTAHVAWAACAFLYAARAIPAAPMYPACPPSLAKSIRVSRTTA